MNYLRDVALVAFTAFVPDLLLLPRVHQGVACAGVVIALISFVYCDVKLQAERGE